MQELPLHLHSVATYTLWPFLSCPVSWVLRHHTDTNLCGLEQAIDTSVSSFDAAGGEGDSSPFEREASLFAAFRREWSLKVAKDAAAAFQKGTKTYRLNLDEFATSEDL